MIINTLITGVKKYFTSLSVDSLWGYKKVSLVVADESKIPTGFEVVIDATESIDVSHSKSVQTHSSESRKVYMDGTTANPVTMTIRGHIETTKLVDIQKLAKDDVWLYVSLTKDMGSPILSMNPSKQNQIGRLESLATGETGGGVGVFSDSKLYFMKSLSIGEEGYINTVCVTIELTEVVLFEYDVEYKFGVKRNSGGGTGGGQTAGTQKVDIRKPMPVLGTPAVDGIEQIRTSELE